MSFFDDFADTFGFGEDDGSTDRGSIRGGSDPEEELPTEDFGDDFVMVTRTRTSTFEQTFDGEAEFETIQKGGAPVLEPEPTEAPDDQDLGGNRQGPPASRTPNDADSLPAPTARPVSGPVPTDNGQSSAQSDVSGTSPGQGSSDGGSNAGAKAGIAIGVLGAIAIVGGLVWFIMMRRKKRQEERQSLDDDEKLHGPFGNPDDRLTEQAPPPPAKASRVSLQRLSLLSSLGLDKRMSRNGGGGGPVTAAAAVPHHQGGNSSWERPFTSQSQNPANPFGSHAERMHTPIPEEPAARPVSPLDEKQARGPGTVSPFGVQEPTFANAVPPQQTPGPMMNTSGMGPVVAAGAAGVVAAGAAAAGLTRQASRNYGGGPKPLDLTVQPPPPLNPAPPSPAPTDYSVNSVTSGQQVSPTAGAAAIAAAGGPQTSAVHRVLLDFKPTLEDEVGLRAGDLVRLLHEYDDGWALVIRLDRSKQGVVPRTCLSGRPLKPRPRPGPGPAPGSGPGPAPRGGPPGHPHGRPMTPQGHPRPQSPAGRPGTSQSNRSMGPSQGFQPYPGSQGPRPQSPGPRYQTTPVARPQSPGGVAAAKLTYQPGPSPMGPNPSTPSSPVGPAAELVAPAPAPAPAQEALAAPQPEAQPQPQLPVQPQARASPPSGPVSRKPLPGQASS